MALTLLAMAVGGLGAGTATVLAQQSTGDAGQHRAAAAPTTTVPSPVPTTTTTTTTSKSKAPKKPASSSRKPSTTKPSSSAERPDPTSTTPTTTTTTPQPRSSEADQVVTLVNQERADAGCRPVRADDRLVTAAQKHSNDMDRRDYFSHESPEGEDFAERIRAEGYQHPGAENIAQGYRSAEQVVQAWMDSDGHRRNILNCDLKAIGVGLSQTEWVWTQDFGF